MNNELKQDNRFLKTNYYRALFPIMFSVLGATINTLIDSVFVAQKLGGDGLAAVNVSMPVYLILCTAGALISGGASVCSAQEAGREDMDEANHYYQDAFFLNLILAIFFTVGGISICRPLSAFFAQGTGIEHLVFQYCIVTFAGTIGIIMAYLFLFYLQLEGKTRAISVAVAIMVSADFVLDLLFIYTLNMGLYGAAAASVISALLSAGYSFWALNKGISNYSVAFHKPDWTRTRKMIRLGSPFALGNLSDAAKLLLLNLIILRSTGADGAAIWAVLNTLSELSLMITNGVPRTAAPLIGAYYSSRENSSIRMLVSLELRSGLFMSILFSAIMVIANRFISYMFNLNSTDFLFPTLCLGISIILSMPCSIWERYFNSTGKIAAANAVVATRSFSFPVLCAAVFAGTYIWLFLPVSAALSLATIFLIIALIKKKSQREKYPLEGILLLDEHLERENKILDFSINADISEACEAAEKITGFCSANDMDPKMTMKLGLVIEELLNVIIQKTPGLKSVDIRTFALTGITGVRIRCAGSFYDPFSDVSSDEDFLMGINMIKKMADVSSHTYTLGMNIMTIIFPDS